MKDDANLLRFIDAQQTSYALALSEIKAGKKKSHWMWFIFPQIQGLGMSETSKYYSIKDMYEATEFLQHPLLGTRLITIAAAVEQLKGTTANRIFGSPDDLKFQSSMTLFAALPGAHPVFESVLYKFFEGQKDIKTVRIIEKR